jgi:hypothetical protein
MAVVVATDEWPRRSLTVAMSTPFSGRRDAAVRAELAAELILSFTVEDVLRERVEMHDGSPRFTTRCAVSASRTIISGR